MDFDQENIDYIDHINAGKQQELLMTPTLTYDNYKKLDELGDPVLKQYILRAVSEDLFQILKNQMESGKELSNDDAVLLKCNISFADRIQHLNNWLKDIDPEKFDTTNITYLDPKIGDCIIPYPDARHRNTVIPDSFEYNKKLAASLIHGTDTPPQESTDSQTQVSTPKDISTENTHLLPLIGGGILLVSGIFIALFISRKRIPPKQ